MLNRGRPRGIALAVVLSVVLLVSVLVSAVGILGIQSLQFESRNLLAQRSIYAAQAGLQHGYSLLLANTSWDGTSPSLSNQALLHTSTDAYTVTVTNNISGSATMTALDGTIVPVGCAHLSSLGQVNLNSYIWWQTHSTATEMVKVSGIWSQYGLFAGSSLQLRGTNLVDSYNSAAASYTEPNPSVSAWSPNSPSSTWQGHDGSSTHEARIGTNSTSPYAIMMQNTTFIDGKLTVGVGGDANSVVGGLSLSNAIGQSVSGTATSVNTPFPQPDVTVPSVSGPNTPNEDVTSTTLSNGVLSPGTYRGMDIGSLSSVTLTSGTYHFTGDITASTIASINLQLSNSSGAPVIIYLDGNWDTSSNNITINNPSNQAANLRILGSGGTTQSIKLGNLSGATYMAVYAPKASVQIGQNVEIFGSIVANSISNDGGLNLHYDSALSSINDPAVLQPLAIGIQ